MPLVAAAVCPHPPLLVPELAAGAAPESQDLRGACDEAVAEVLGAGPDLLIIVGAGPRTVRLPAGVRGSLRGYGVPREVVLGEPPADGSAAAAAPYGVCNLAAGWSGVPA